jgi:hypothetical protein
LTCLQTLQIPPGCCTLPGDCSHGPRSRLTSTSLHCCSQGSGIHCCLQGHLGARPAGDEHDVAESKSTCTMQLTKEGGGMQYLHLSSVRSKYRLCKVQDSAQHTADASLWRLLLLPVLLSLPVRSLRILVCVCLCVCLSLLMLLVFGWLLHRCPFLKLGPFTHHQSHRVQRKYD